MNILKIFILALFHILFKFFSARLFTLHCIYLKLNDDNLTKQNDAIGVW